MKMTTLRRGFYAALAGGMLGAASVIALPVTTAAPNCSNPPQAAQVKAAASAVNGYLDANPAVRQQLMDIATQPHDQAIAAFRSYYDSNPQIANDLRAVQSKANSIAGQCANEAIPAYLQEAFEAL